MRYNVDINHTLHISISPQIISFRHELYAILMHSFCGQYIYNQSFSLFLFFSLSLSYGNWLQNFRNIPAYCIEKLLNSGDGPLNTNRIFR